MDVDPLTEQLLNYQLLLSEEIPTTAKNSAGLELEDAHRLDILWGYLRGLRTPGSNQQFDAQISWGSRGHAPRSP